MIEKHLYDPILQLFRENKDRYNMINSAIVELFEFIVKECHSNYKLITYLVLRFRPDFMNVKYVHTFETLIQKYETHQELKRNGDQNNKSAYVFFEFWHNFIFNINFYFLI
jgi:protein phosphatase-4 regulatory subunit 3